MDQYYSRLYVQTYPGYPLNFIKETKQHCVPPNLEVGSIAVDFLLQCVVLLLLSGLRQAINDHGGKWYFRPIKPGEVGY